MLGCFAALPPSLPQSWELATTTTTGPTVTPSFHWLIFTMEPPEERRTCVPTKPSSLQGLLGGSCCIQTKQAMGESLLEHSHLLWQMGTPSLCLAQTGFKMLPLHRWNLCSCSPWRMGHLCCSNTLPAYMCHAH